MLICEWLKTDEHVQVNGITMFIDCTNVTIQHHYKLVNLDAIKKMIQYYQVIPVPFLVLLDLPLVVRETRPLHLKGLQQDFKWFQK